MTYQLEDLIYEAAGLSLNQGVQITAASNGKVNVKYFNEKGLQQVEGHSITTAVERAVENMKAEAE